MIKRTLYFCILIGMLGLTEQCGRSKEDDDRGTDARVPGDWDGKKDYEGSSFKIETKNQ